VQFIKIEKEVVKTIYISHIVNTDYQRLYNPCFKIKFSVVKSLLYLFVVLSKKKNAGFKTGRIDTQPGNEIQEQSLIKERTVF